MKKVLKEYVFEYKSGNNKVISNYKAVIKPSYNGNYRIIVSSKSYLKCKLKSRKSIQCIYSNPSEMAEVFEKVFNLCNKSPFKKSIKIINS